MAAGDVVGRRERLAVLVVRRLLGDRGISERTADHDAPEGTRRAAELPLDQPRFARFHGGTPGSPVAPFLAVGISVQSVQEPPEVLALWSVSVFVCLPPGKARLRRRVSVASESVCAQGRI